MARFNNRLDSVHVAAPCPADWDSMYGNERVRFCGQCRLNVYNLSEMSRAEAEQLIGQGEGRLCVRYYRRKDGSILTQNCPVGLRLLKRRLTRIATAVASLIFTLLASLGAHDLVGKLRFRYSHEVGASPLAGAVNVSDLEQSTIVVTVGSPSPPIEITTGQLIPIPRNNVRRHGR